MTIPDRLHLAPWFHGRWCASSCSQAPPQPRTREAGSAWTGAPPRDAEGSSASRREVGYAVNVNDRWALGGSVAVDTGNETERILVRARARRWLTPRLYADALSGFFRQERDLLYRSGDHAVENSGLSTELRVGMAGYGFVLARYDLVRAGEELVALPGSQHVAYAPGGRAHALSVGGGLEGRTALLAAAATALGMVLVGIVVGGPGT